MRFIAKKHFCRTPQLADVKLDKPIHDKMIHKGAIFEVGSKPAFEDLSRDDQKLIATLRISGCVGDASDSEVVARVKAEVEVDRKREARDAVLAADRRPDFEAIASQMLQIASRK